MEPTARFAPLDLGDSATVVAGATQQGQDFRPVPAQLAREKPDPDNVPGQELAEGVQVGALDRLANAHQRRISL